MGQRGIGAVGGPGFTTAAEANQTHAQAGTRAGGWADGVASSATAVNNLAGAWPLFDPCKVRARPQSALSVYSGTFLPTSSHPFSMTHVTCVHGCNTCLQFLCDDYEHMRPVL